MMRANKQGTILAQIPPGDGQKKTINASTSTANLGKQKPQSQPCTLSTKAPFRASWPVVWYYSSTALCRKTVHCESTWEDHWRLSPCPLRHLQHPPHPQSPPDSEWSHPPIQRSLQLAAIREETEESPYQNQHAQGQLVSPGNMKTQPTLCSSSTALSQSLKSETVHITFGHFCLFDLFLSKCTAALYPDRWVYKYTQLKLLSLPQCPENWLLYAFLTWLYLFNFLLIFYTFCILLYFFYVAPWVWEQCNFICAVCWACIGHLKIKWTWN